MKTPFIISIVLNIVFVLGFLVYMTTPIFDKPLIDKSLPRICNYAEQHDAYQNKSQKTICKFVNLNK